MPAHFVNANKGAFPFNTFLQMLAYHSHAFINRRWLQHFTRFKIMFNLPEYPWITDRRAANHNAIHTVTVFIFHCLLRAVNIAITENRNGNARVIFHFPDQGPVSLSFVHLHARAAMNG